MPILLKEYYQLEPTKESLLEARAAIRENRPVIVKGVIQRADAKNQNGRVYPYNILKKVLDDYDSEYVQKGLALGELDHREEPVVNLEKLSHRIVKMWWEGKDVHGEVEIFDTPCGKIAQELVAKGVPLGISSRAVGSVSKNESSGADVVEDDLQMVCFDLVGTPSTHEAFLREGKVHRPTVKEVDEPKITITVNTKLKETLSDLLGKEIK